METESSNSPHQSCDNKIEKGVGQAKESVLNKEAQKEMLMHLHEQFAINHNENLGSLITLFVAMLGVLGAYGAILLDAGNFGGHFDYEERVIITTIFADLVLTILIIINAYQGYHVRKDQFVIHRIRKFYGLDRLQNNDGSSVVDYTPHKKNILTYITGLYGIFAGILFSVLVFLNVVSIISLNNLFAEINATTWLAIALLIICCLCIFTILFIIYYYWNKYKAKVNKGNQENNKSNRNIIINFKNEKSLFKIH